MQSEPVGFRAVMAAPQGLEEEIASQLASAKLQYEGTFGLAAAVDAVCPAGLTATSGVLRRSHVQGQARDEGGK